MPVQESSATDAAGLDNRGFADVIALIPYRLHMPEYLLAQKFSLIIDKVALQSPVFTCLERVIH